MRKILLGLFSCCLMGPLWASTELPNDVAKFIVKRESCDHFRGETDNQVKMKELHRKIEKWCKGTDRALKRLKGKYAEDEAILNRLGEFESNIEVSKQHR